MKAGKSAPEPGERAAGLTWALKDSFISYVSALHDGRITTSDGATDSDDFGFHFPFIGLEGLDSDGASGRVRFGGTVAIAGHGGMLALTLSNPVLVMLPDSCQLFAEIRGESRPFADLLPLSPRRNGSSLEWHDWTPTLTAEGARELQGHYFAGEELAPMSVRAPLPAV